MLTLSEQWATAYVQIILTLLIFLISPLLARQIAAQEDVWNVFLRRTRGATLFAMIVGFHIFAFISIIWFMNPPYAKKNLAALTTKPTPTATIPAATSSPVAAQTPEPSSPVPEPRPSSSAAPTDDGEPSDLLSLVVVSVMISMPLVAMLAGTVLGTYLRRNVLVSELELKLGEDFRGGDSSRSFLHRFYGYTVMKKRLRRGAPASVEGPAAARSLDAGMLHDLIYLGQHGKAGKEKMLVLDALDRIAEQMQKPPRYQGDELGDLIRGLVLVVRNSEQPGKDDDYARVIEIIKVLRERLSNARKLTSLDAGLTGEALEALGVTAVKTMSVQTASKYLEEASVSNNSRAVFDMGLAALDHKRFQTATSALNKLAVLARDSVTQAEAAARRADEDERKAAEAGPKEKEERRRVAGESRQASEESRRQANNAVSDLLGMIAQFKAAGTSARKCADMYLALNSDSFYPSLAARLAEAFTHHYESNNFDTADKVAELLTRLNDGTWSMVS